MPFSKREFVEVVFNLNDKSYRYPLKAKKTVFEMTVGETF